MSSLATDARLKTHGVENRNVCHAKTIPIFDIFEKKTEDVFILQILFNSLLNYVVFVVIGLGATAVRPSRLSLQFSLERVLFRGRVSEARDRQKHL